MLDPDDALLALARGDVCASLGVGLWVAVLVERAATPGPEREDLVRRGLAHAATFTWSQTASGHVAAYRRAQELTS